MLEQPALEALIDRLVPEKQRWKGASETQISEIEGLAGRPIPEFYRWFLTSMGGSYTYGLEDFRASTVIDTYGSGVVRRDARYLLIGRIIDPLMPGLILHDLDSPFGIDAAVGTRTDGAFEVSREFQTLREMLVFDLLSRFRLYKARQRCSGSFTDPGGRVFEHLNAAMEQLNFTRPIETGEFCGFFERDDAVMLCMNPMEHAEGGLQFFDLGAGGVKAIRRLLGEITTLTQLKLEIDEWDPELKG
jgi:hypothetical protein